MAVTAGQRLVIAVRVTVPDYSFPIAVERPWAGYANATAAAGQSYVSGDGVTWTDMTRALADTDVCLKGYGVSSEQPGAGRRLPTPEPSATPTPARADRHRRRRGSRTRPRSPASSSASPTRTRGRRRTSG